MRSFSSISTIVALAANLLNPSAHAAPEVLAAAFQQPKAIGHKGRMKRPALLPIPEEYKIYFRAKAVLARPFDLKIMESVEREILESRMHAQSKTLEKELDEIFYALEIKRGTRMLTKKLWASGLESYQRGLSGLAPFKWIYYWDETDSKQLSIACTRKNADENCFALAKKVLDAFPKVALETNLLRGLNFPTPTPAPLVEGSNDRLSQTYTEKIEKDEVDFQEVLGFFQNAKDIDLLKSAKAFVVNYPKSALRFRATFLMAESFYRTGSKKEAQPLYQSLIDQTPLSFYAIVSSERLGLSLRDQVKKDPTMIDPDLFNPNAADKKILARARGLFDHRNYDEVGIELDTLFRVRNYTTDFLLYLTRFAYDSNQNLSSFRFVNELIQRKYDRLLSSDILGIVFADRYSKEIAEEAALDHVDPMLVVSLMKQESGFRAPILSSSGALGLMQLMSFTALETEPELKLRTLKDPKTNIHVGTKYLQSLLEKYDGNIAFALSAYNAGPNRVAKWRRDLKPDASMIDYIESIPYHETRDYVMAILRNRYWYETLKGLPVQSVSDSWKVPPAK
jgi:soluble lytic murein transglycosylase-like protein